MYYNSFFLNETHLECNLDEKKVTSPSNILHLPVIFLEKITSNVYFLNYRT